MKTLTLALLAAFTAVSLAAEKPADILASYREKAGAALSRLNSTFDAECAKVTSSLVRLGDTATVATMGEQITQKKAGEPVLNPVPQAVQLFSQYDFARRSQLRPIQDQSIARIDALLKTSEGQKLDVVTDLGKVRAEIESGKLLAPAKLPEMWSYMQKPDGKPEADVRFSPNGKFEMGEGANRTTGKWRLGPETDTLVIDIAGSKAVWTVQIKGDLATVQRPDVGTRYFRMKK